MKSFVFLLFLSLFFHLAYSSEDCSVEDENCPVKKDICPVDNYYFDNFLECSVFYFSAPVFGGNWNKHIKNAIESCERMSGINYAFDQLFYSAISYLDRESGNNEFEEFELDIYEFGSPNLNDEDWSGGTWSDDDWDSENLYPVLDECRNKRDNLLKKVKEMTWLNI